MNKFQLEKYTMHKQQIILGWLCTLLPFAALFFGLIGGITHCNPENWWYSISATYYSNSKIIMIGLLFTTGIYFWAYQGYDTIDKLITNLCAIFSFAIIAFPCQISSINNNDLIGIFCLPACISQWCHCISAGILYTCFGFMMLRFRKTDGKNITKEKKIRNTLYLIFTIILACCGIIMPFKGKFNWPGWSVIILETIVQMSFGLSWLIKAGAFSFLNDKPAIKSRR